MKVHLSNQLFIKTTLCLAIAALSVSDIAVVANAADGKLALAIRTRVETSKESGRFHTLTKAAEWNARKTAIVVCDMWDLHHCLNATKRGGEMAPRMNNVLKEARKRGVTIIHAPSSCTNFYQDHPARLAAIKTPRSKNLPEEIGKWCYVIPSEERGKYPLDQTDGGEDDDLDEHRKWAKELAAKGRKPGSPWKSQTDLLEIDDKDFISDNGEEIWSIMETRGIDNVILLGVHTNMCVLGRPFGLRQMAKNGKNVVLMRDLTDTMYNPARWPYVSHFTGTDLIVEHIEKFVCPTITSDQILGGKPFRFKNDDRPHLVIIMAEREYKTDETLPPFSVDHLGKDFRISYVHANAKDRNDLPGVEVVNDADVLLISARRRVLPKSQLDVIRKFIDSGKPVVGIRTASHAFTLRNKKPPEGYSDWPELDQQVWGGNYSNHHGNGPRVSVELTAEGSKHAILAGVDLKQLHSSGSLYVVSPLTDTTTALLIGSVPGKPSEPVAWTNSTKGHGRTFYTSMGHPEDFKLPAFNVFLRNAIYWAAGLPMPSPVSTTSITLPDKFKHRWANIDVPGMWEEQFDGALKDYDGIAWYRSTMTIPGGWTKKESHLLIEQVDNAHEVFINGTKIGGAGSFPPNYKSGLKEKQRYAIKPGILKSGANTIAVRVYDNDGKGGFKGIAPIIANGESAIGLNGGWEFRIGNDPQWANQTCDLTSTAIFWRVHKLADVRKRFVAGGTGALSPQAAMKRFVVPKDLEIQQLLTEPIVRQPLFMDFDERGRLWVLQYLQYPYPAGLKIVSKDSYWRSVYDKVPEPPPHGARGADRITIHEDTDGDGVYDKHKTFLDGLNIATSCARGRGGLWVLNPPYLLFYPDKNNDDVPDGDPQVHLQGFGMEDTHSVANSIRWGPDGWLYAAQGSTVSANIMRTGLDKKKTVHSMGQLIWRYHPETRRYEIFAEGGGNAFGVEIDGKGRIYSGHNGGNTRGFHYVQGGYFRKGFTKHGPLSNPYSFGFFNNMAHAKVPRFTHNFIIYAGTGLPERYHGKLFGVEPMQGQVVQSSIQPDTSTFKTQDINRPILTDDVSFRPVDIKVGPDGAIYVADLYEPQISHREHFSGQVDKTTGRIYRLQAKGAKPTTVGDLGKLTSDALVEVLRHPNKWHRQMALRLLGDRRDRNIIPKLKRNVRKNSGQFALECLWALYQTGGFDNAFATQMLEHEDQFVRAWTVRLLCDEKKVASEIAPQLAALAASESYVYVRSQLASSAKRIPAADALPIVRGLLTHDEDGEDLHLPLLLWWAIESKCQKDAASVVELFSDSQVWKLPIVEEHILSRLMQRFAMAGSRNDLLVCAQLFQRSPSEKHSKLLMAGFEAAFKGRPLTGLPAELSRALIKAGGGSLTLQIRQGDKSAVAKGLEQLADAKTKKNERIELAQTFGEVNEPKSIPVLLKALSQSSDDEFRMTVLTSLIPYSDPSIGEQVVQLYARFSQDVRLVAETLLVSRAKWTVQLLEAIESGYIDRKSIPLLVVRKMTIHRNNRIAELVAKHWKDIKGASTAEMQQQIQDFSQLIGSGKGDPYSGKRLYSKSCAKCHLLYGEGGRVGPDLTTYNRDDVLRVLLNVVNPSAEIREGFETKLILTEDGRTVTGFVYDEDSRVVVLRGVDGRNITVPKDQIDETIPQRKSIMPEGLLKELSEQQVRDLFAYLRSAQPLNN